MFRLFILTILAFITGCSVNTEPVKIMGDAQGTYYSIIYYNDNQEDWQYEIDSILNDFDKSVSLWVPNSIISKVNNNDSSVILDDYFIDNFRLAQQVSEATNGDFDITIGPLAMAWGFGFNNQVNVDSIIVDSLLKLTGFRNIKIENGKIIKSNPNIKIDFNAIAQGYSVDVIGRFLESKGIKTYLIDIGGEVRARGKKPNGDFWKVGIEKPAKNSDDERILNGVIKLLNKSVATSGSYRKFIEKDGKRYSHMISPKTGYPTQDSLLSVTIIGDNTATADAYATACMIMGLEKAITLIEKEANLEALFIYSGHDGNYHTHVTNGFNEILVSKFN